MTMHDEINPLVQRDRDTLVDKAMNRLRDAGGFSPDTMGKAEGVSRETGIPALELVQTPQDMANRENDNAMRSTLETAPRLTNWLDKPDNSILGQDELNLLARYERLGIDPNNPEGTGVGRAVERAGLRLRSSGALFTAVATDTAMDDAERTDEGMSTEVFLQATGLEEVPPGMDVSTSEAAIKAINDMGFPADRGVMYQQLLEKRISNAQLAADQPEVFRERAVTAVEEFNRLQTEAAAIPMSPGAEEMGAILQKDTSLSGTAMAFLKNPVIGATFLGEVAAESAPIIATSIAASVITRSPTISAAVMGAGTIAQEYGSSANEFLLEEGVTMETREDALRLLADDNLLEKASERGATRGIVIAAFEVLGQGAAARTIFSSPLAETLAQGTVQGLTGFTGELAAQAAAGQDVNLQEAFIEGLAEVVTTPFEYATARVGAERTRRQETAAGIAEAKSIEDLNSLVTDTKLRDRSPRAFRSLMQANGVNTRSIYIDGAVLAEAAEADSSILSTLDVTAAQLQRASEGGHSVPVNLQTYVQNVPGKAATLEGLFVKHGHMKADVASGAQAEAYMATEMGERQKEVAQRQDEGAKIETLRDRVTSDVQAQLIAAGQSPTVARNSAQLHGAFVQTMAERYGTDTIAEQFKLAVTGPGTPTQRSPQQQRILAQREMDAEAEAFETSVPETGEAPTVTDEQRAELEAGRLPSGIDSTAFLYETPDSTLVPLDAIKPIRARADGIANARPLMAKAALSGSRRQPLSVRQEADGTYTLLDGNSTYAVLSELEATDVPVRVFTDEDFAAEQVRDSIRKVLKAPGKKPRYIDGTALNRGENKAAWELLRETQPYGSLEEMMLEAQADHDALQDAVNEAAAAAGIEDFRPAPVKTVDSARRKINDKYNGNHRMANDIARAGFNARTLQQADAVISALSEKYTVWDEGYSVTEAGYFDRKVAVLLPSGRWAEVQTWPPGMLDAKESKGHALYEQYRTTRDDAVKEAARQQMLDTYAPVVGQLDPSWGAVLASELANEDLASRIADTPVWNSASEISGLRSSASTAAASTGYSPDPATITAEPSSSTRTNPGSLENQRVMGAPFNESIGLSGADVNTGPSLRVLKQSGPRRQPKAEGERTGVAMPTNLSAASELALAEQFRTGRDFKLALQERARTVHGDSLMALTPENQTRVADFIVEDALEAVQDNGNAIGWYDNAVTRAKAELVKLYPELAEGGQDEFAFIWGLAVTSNGLKVDKNFELAADVYERWKADGAFPTDIGIGQAAAGINTGLAMYDKLLGIFDGDWAAARDFMVREQEVRQIEKTTGLKISGEAKGETVRGAAVLGPKIGNGFFSNLYGYFDGLTMDRWLMRSVGRWRGSLVSINEPMVAQKRTEIRDLAKLMTPEEQAFMTGFFNGTDIKVSNRMSAAQVDALAMESAKRSMDPGFRSRLSAAADGKGDLFRKLTNALAKYLDGQVEAPAGAKERSFIRGAFKQALEDLQQQPGMEALTMADLQALLWYPEKLLYESAKKPAGEEIKSYADDEAPDYGNAARNLVRDRLGSAGGASGLERGTDVSGPRAAESAAAGELDDTGRATGNDGEQLARLEGAPAVEGASGPDAALVAVADQYAAAQGIDLKRQSEFVEIDEARAVRIADAYEKMEHAPQDPEVRAAYDNLIQQTTAQYRALEAAGYQFYFFNPEADPYADSPGGFGNPWNAMRDLRANKQMAVYPTADGFGTQEAFNPDENPMLALTDIEWSYGTPDGPKMPVTANDLFRAVHDAFGHGIEGSGFRARGEENAWQAHIRMFTGSAVAAITTETRGQNSWLNYGPYGEQNRTASVEDTVFADQKTGLMPEFTWTEGRAGDQDRVLQQDARGEIRIPASGVLDGTTVIDLFKTSDESTFLHESGHFFLEIFQSIASRPDAPVSMVDDLITINEFLGRSPDDVSEYTTPQQEQWAEAFEVYLMEGTAPSPSLKSAFSKFASWLVRVYTNALNIGAQPSPEIKAVMDRMLATNEEIDTARAETDSQALFSEIPPGMTEAEWAPYRRLVQREEGETRGRLLKQTMAVIRRKRTKDYKARRSELITEISAELAQTPVYRIIDGLGNGEFGQDAKLNKQQLVDMFGDKVLRDLGAARNKTKGNMYADGGVDIEVAADTFGYDSIKQLVDEVRASPPIAVAVEAEATRRIENELGDPMDDTSIREEAEAALKNGMATERVAREVAALDRAAGGNAGPNRWQQQNAAAKAQATTRVDQLTVREAMGYRQYLRASQTAAREAQRQLATVVRRADGTPQPGSRDALKAAADAKRKQLLNDHMYRIAREKARRIESARKRFQRLQKRSMKQRVGAEFMDVVDSLLDQYSFRVMPIREVRRRGDIRQLYQQMLDENRGSEMAIPLSVLADTQQRHYTELAVAELEGVIDAIDNVVHMGRATTKQIAADTAFDTLTAMEAIEARADENLKEVPLERESGERGRGADLYRQFQLHVLNTDSILRDIDGDQTALGPAYNAIKRGIDRGVAQADQRRQQAARDIAEIYDRFLGGHKEIAKLRNNKKVYQGLGDKPLTRLGLLSMALNAGNEQNWERLTNSEGKGTFDAGAVQRTLVAELTDNEWAFVQGMWDYLDSYWPEIRAQERKYTGVTPKKVDTQLMIEGAPSFVTGGYYPIRYDTEISTSSDDLERAKLATEGTVGVFGKAQTSHGHTEARVKSTGRPIDLSMGVIDNHVFNVIHDLELRGPVRDAARIVFSERFGDMMTNKGRGEDTRALKTWLQDVAAGDKVLAYGMERWFRWMRGGFTLSAIGFKAATIMIQPLGLAQSMVQVGSVAMARGYAQTLKQGHGKMHRFAVAKSAIMEERIRTFDRDISQITGELAAGEKTQRGYQRVINSYLPYAYAGMQHMQYWVVDLPTWVASYEQALRNGESDADAVVIADRDVRVAQGSGLMSDRGMLERGRISPTGTPHEMARLFTVLGSYMFSKFNLAYRRARGTDFKNPAAIAKLTMDFTLLFIAESMLVYLMRNGWPDEDDDEPPLPMIAAREGLYTAMGTMPVFREMAGAIQGFGGGSAYSEYTGASSALFEGMGKVTAGLVEGDLETATDRRNIENLLSFGGTAFFLPSGQINGMLDAVFTRDWEVEDDAVANFLESITGLPFGGEDES